MFFVFGAFKRRIVTPSACSISQGCLISGEGIKTLISCPCAENSRVKSLNCTAPELRSGGKFSESYRLCLNCFSKLLKLDKSANTKKFTVEEVKEKLNKTNDIINRIENQKVSENKTVELNFDAIQETTERFDPKNQIPRSEVITTENSDSSTQKSNCR